MHYEKNKNDNENENNILPHALTARHRVACACHIARRVRCHLENHGVWWQHVLDTAASQCYDILARKPRTAAWHDADNVRTAARQKTAPVRKLDENN